jgi:hypothetical protein
MPMTCTGTTLTRGQYAQLLLRSFPSPHSTLSERVRPVFLRRDLRHRANFFAKLCHVTGFTSLFKGPAFQLIALSYSLYQSADKMVDVI